MHDKYFFDSNIWLYLFLEKGSRKSLIAKQYIEKSVLLSIVEWLFRIATIQDFTQEVLLKASSLREQYSISYWDSLIVAAALEANCQLLYSEDMQDGLKIKSLTIRNIFAKHYICAP